MNYKPDDTISDKYRVIEPIGGGAMGMVYKAEHILMHKMVAIKVLHQDMNNNVEMIERFKREASSAANIDHVNVCSVMDFAVSENGEFYLVMEYLEGRTLQKKIREEGRISPRETVFIMKQLLSALQSAHDHGIIHRDVKPENVVLISKDGTDDFVKLLDFGIAHQDEASCIPKDEEEGFKTKAGFLYGTPEYISPEQANGAVIDNRTDLYACGIILYEMLTGSVPFESDSLVQLLHYQVFKEVPHLDVDSIECGQEFDDIIQKLLAKKADDRYASALDVIEVLDSLGLSEHNASSEVPMHVSSGGDSLARLMKPLRNSKIYKVARTCKQKFVATTVGQKISSAYCKIPKKRRCILWGILAASLLLLIIVNAMPATLEEVDISDDGTASKSLKRVSNVQDYIYDDNESILNDKTLVNDPNLRKALDAFYQKEYRTCYENVQAVEGRYSNHPNYLRFRMQSACMFAKNDKTADVPELAKQIVSDFLVLAKRVPDAARNKAVADAVAFVFTESKKLTSSVALAEIMKSDDSDVALALAWAIIYSPYDQSDKRKKEMFAAFDALDSSKVPDWQKMTLEAWRLGKEKCNERNEKLREALMSGASNNDLYYGILLPLNAQDGKNCKSGRFNWGKSNDCNHCMRAWITAGYEEWSALAEEDKLSKAKLTFLEESK